MPWDPQFSVHMAELDAQHQYLFALLDQVETASKLRAHGRFPGLIEELLRYATYHFTSEEALMDSYGFPSEAHREEHVQLLRRAEGMLNAPDFRPAALRLFLYNWLVDHIQISDLELARFVSDKRREVEASITQDSGRTPASR